MSVAEGKIAPSMLPYYWLTAVGPSETSCHFPRTVYISMVLHVGCRKLSRCQTVPRSCHVPCRVNNPSLASAACHKKRASSRSRSWPRQTTPRCKLLIEVDRRVKNQVLSWSCAVVPVRAKRGKAGNKNTASCSNPGQHGLKKARKPQSLQGAHLSWTNKHSDNHVSQANQSG